jgi:hypothetical protein
VLHMQQAILRLLAQTRIIIRYCTERDTIVRSIKMALIVGTILAIINHGQDMLTGQLSPRWIVPMLITYLVPFSVVTFGQVQGKRQRDRAQKLMQTTMLAAPLSPEAVE